MSLVSRVMDKRKSKCAVCSDVVVVGKPKRAPKTWSRCSACLGGPTSPHSRAITFLLTSPHLAGHDDVFLTAALKRIISIHRTQRHTVSCTCMTRRSAYFPDTAGITKMTLSKATPAMAEAETHYATLEATTDCSPRSWSLGSPRGWLTSCEFSDAVLR